MNIASKIESLLLISHKPMQIKRLAKLLETKEEEIKEVLGKLDQKYNEESGIVIMRDENSVQLVTAKANSELVKHWLKEEQAKELTRPALETLTIITYRGPVAKSEIDTIRGINCSLILRNLLIRGLIEEKVGKTDFDTMYSISFEFMRWLGLKDIQELPEYGKLNKNEYLEELLSKVGK